jgi:phosphatidyl-myo-inositol dimannoside synthase
MKFLFYCPGYPPPLIGGSLVYYYYLHSTFSADELFVLAAKRKDTEAFDHEQRCTIIRKGYINNSDARQPYIIKTMNLARIFFESWKLIFIKKIDVIHIGPLYPAAFMGALLSAVTGRPFAVTVMGEDLTRLKHTGALRRALTEWSLKKASKVIAISSFGRKLLMDGGIPDEKIILLPPGVDFGKCSKENAEEPVIWQKIKDKKVILTVGRLIKRKGQDMVLKALPDVLPIVPEAHYLIVGSGPEEAELKRIADELDLTADHVAFLPKATDGQIAFLYEHCRLFIMPNRELPNGDTEGFGIVFLEAGFWGKPVIGGNAGGVPDAVIDGVNGLLVDGNDVKQISSALIKILGNEGLAASLGMAGHARAINENWTDKSRQYKQALADMRLKR